MIPRQRELLRMANSVIVSFFVSFSPSSSYNRGSDFSLFESYAKSEYRIPAPARSATAVTATAVNATTVTATADCTEVLGRNAHRDIGINSSSEKTVAP